MSLNEHAPQRRRRGDELESALLEAAWRELDERGYDALTIDAVAARAGTSRAVIYRRWPGKPALVMAAIAHGSRRDQTAIPDTGNVRDDLIALMELANEQRMGVATLVNVRLGEFYRETGTSMADLRELIVGDSPSAADVVIRRGVERGEIDEAKLTPRIRRLPSDLFRHEVLMTFQPVSRADIEEIVDTIFLPLVRP